MQLNTIPSLLVQAAVVLLLGTANAHILKASVPKSWSFKIDLSNGVDRMLDLARDYRLPEEPEYPGLGWTAGMDLDVLKSLRKQWVESYDWQREEEYMNSFSHFTTEIEGLTTHFIHERSSNPDAIPLLLEHGWPGSFLEFAPIIKELTKPAETFTGKTVAFHVVVPSLSGFAFSEAPPANWTVDDTARVHHALMTDILGYEKFAVHGTDFGAPVAFGLYDQFNQSTRAAHFVFLPFYPLNVTELEAEGIELSELELFETRRFEEWNTIGNGYFQVQATKPNTIGLALYDSPIGQLSWIGEKVLAWSDPRAGTLPSLITPTLVLNFVSLYYLIHSFISSVFMYYQNPTGITGFKFEYTKARTDAPLLFSAFKYNVGFWPKEMVERVGMWWSIEITSLEGTSREWIIRRS